MTYTIVAFEAPGTYAWDIPAGVTLVDVLVVAGGGAGAAGGTSSSGGGGGGSGGVIFEEHFDVSALSSVTVVVGEGGAGGSANRGGASSFHVIAASGGGYGSRFTYAGGNGGAGGGGGDYTTGQIGDAGSGTLGQGYDGGDGYNGGTTGNGSGGGGGASSAGGAGTETVSGNGGEGYDASAIFGTDYGDNGVFGGGGGGGAGSGSTAGAGGVGGGANGGSAGTSYDGVDGAGGGGGGGTTGNTPGGGGGSGIVLIRYANAPSYAITPDVSAQNESGQIVYTITTTGIADGTNLSLSINGSSTASGSDFDEFGSTYETITINSNTATFTLNVRDDITAEGGETIALDLWDDEWPNNTTVVATSDPTTINDTSTGAGLSFSISIDTGYYQSETDSYIFAEITSGSIPSTLEFTVTAAGGTPPAGSVFYTIDGDWDNSDLDSGSLSGTLVFDGNNEATVTIVFAADAVTEGSETSVINIRTQATNGPIIETSKNLVLTDNSQAAPAYSLVPSVTNTDEGTTVTFNFTGTTVPVGTVLFFNVVAGSDISAADVSGGQLSGSFIVDSGDIIESYGSFSMTFLNDLTTEGSEDFSVELRTGDENGPVVDTTVVVTVEDTSVNPPEFYLSQNKTGIGEGGVGVTYTITTRWFTGSQLFGTITGTADGADFNQSLPVTINLTETTYPEKEGQVTLSAAYDELLEGLENFTFHVHTDSAAGPEVLTAESVDIDDEQWTLTLDKYLVTEGDSYTITAVGVNAQDGTYYINTTGNFSDLDFTDDTLTIPIVVSGGVGTVVRTLKVDALQDGAEYGYHTLHRTSYAGQQLASTSALLAKESIINFDTELDSTDGVWILLLNMYHSAGVERISNYPYVSKPGDTLPNQTYEACLEKTVNIRQRIDGKLSVGTIAVINDGTLDAWLDLLWHGYAIEMLMGRPEWSLDDFTIVAKIRNGGIDKAEQLKLGFAVFDNIAVLNKPLLTNFHTDGQPIPRVFGKPRNVTGLLIDQATRERQVNDGTLTSIVVRSNGTVVPVTANLAAGTFTLDNNELGTITCDPVQPLLTAATILSSLATEFGITVDSATTSALPTYELGLYFSSASDTGMNVAQAIAGSLYGYYHVDVLDQLKIYQLEVPAVSADFVITKDDIEAGTFKIIEEIQPYASVTVRYDRNWTVQARDSLAGELDTGDAAYAESLTKEWREVVVENSLSGYPETEHLVINTHLKNEVDATALATLIAGLHQTKRRKAAFTALLSSARSTIGQTAEIHYPGYGFASGLNARVIAVDRNLTQYRIPMEVWL